MECSVPLIVGVFIPICACPLAKFNIVNHDIGANIVNSAANLELDAGRVSRINLSDDIIARSETRKIINLIRR